MKKNLLFFCICLVWGSSFTFAQISYGIRGGVNITSYSGNKASDISNLGFQLGGMVDFPFSKNFGAETGVFFLQRNFSGTSSEFSYGESYTWKTEIYGLRIPVACFFQKGIENWKAQIKLGGFLIYGFVANDYSLSSSTAAQLYFANPDNNLKGEKYFDAGITAGVSFFYSVFSFSIDADLSASKAFESDRFGKGTTSGFFFSFGCDF